MSPFARVPRAAYSTVQCGPGHEDNIELNSDLVYGEWIDKGGLRKDSNLSLPSSKPLL